MATGTFNWFLMQRKGSGSAPSFVANHMSANAIRIPINLAIEALPLATFFRKYLKNFR